MSFERRQVLQALSFTFGTGFLLPQGEIAVAAQNPAPPAQAAAKHESEATEREKVAGIGGFFFPSTRSEGVGTVVPGTPGDPVTGLAARGRKDLLQSLSRDQQIFRGSSESLDGELSSA